MCKCILVHNYMHKFKRSTKYKYDDDRRMLPRPRPKQGL